MSAGCRHEIRRRRGRDAERCSRMFEERRTDGAGIGSDLKPRVGKADLIDRAAVRDFEACGSTEADEDSAVAGRAVDRKTAAAVNFDRRIGEASGADGDLREFTGEIDLA